MRTEEENSMQVITAQSTASQRNIQLHQVVLAFGVALFVVATANVFVHCLSQVAPRGAFDTIMRDVDRTNDALELQKPVDRLSILVIGFVPTQELAGLDSDKRLLISSSVGFEWVTERRPGTGLLLSGLTKVDIAIKHQRDALIPILDRHSRTAGRKVDIVGFADHFTPIEDTIEREFTTIQVRRFPLGLAKIAEDSGGIRPHIRVSCPNPSQRFVEAEINLVHCGISMSGLWSTRGSWFSLTTEEQGRVLESRGGTRKSDMSVGLPQANPRAVV